MIFKEAIEAQLRFHIRIREQIREALDKMPEGNVIRRRSWFLLNAFCRCSRNQFGGRFKRKTPQYAMQW